MASGGASTDMISSAGSPGSRRPGKAKVTTRKIVIAARMTRERTNFSMGNLVSRDLHLGRRLRAMTRDLAPVRQRPHGRELGAALGGRERAARVEGTARRDRRRIGRVAL